MKSFFLISVFIIGAFLLQACNSDNNEDVNIELSYDQSEHEIDSLIGYFRFDYELSRWVITPSRSHNNPFVSIAADEDAAFLIVENEDLIDHKYRNQMVEIKGVYKLVSQKPTSSVGGVTSIYTIKIELISFFKENSTRNTLQQHEICKSQAINVHSSTADYIRTEHIPAPYAVDYSKNYNFRVFVHVIKNSSGLSAFPVSANTISNGVVSTLNSYYAETGISFVLYGKETVNSDYYYNLDLSALDNVFNLNPHSNAFDVYVICNPEIFVTDDGGIVYGKSGGAGTTCCYINTNRFLTTTMPHEIGHCLGLYHTHYGSGLESGWGISEFVDHSNSYEAGDYIYDTPADPGFWNEDGTYMSSLNLKDPHNQSYNPDPSNIMSYSSARTSFSRHQVAKMFKWIDYYSTLKSAANIVTNNISGADFIYQTAYYSVSCPSNYIVSWDITCETYGSPSGTVISTSTEVIQGSSISITPTEHNSSQKYTLTATLTSPNGFVKTITKTVYHVVISSISGRLAYSTGTTSGNLSFTSYSTINIRQGDLLYLYYYDATGAHSIKNSSIYYFNINDGGANVFTKNTNFDNIFTLSSTAGTGTMNALVQVGVPGSMKLAPVHFNIKSQSSTLSNDSTEILKEYLYEKIN